MTSTAFLASAPRDSGRSIRAALGARFGCLSTMTLGAVGLAATALIGRGVTFLVAGPAPMVQLLVLLALAIAALVTATRARRGARAGGWNARLSGMAQRIGAIQTLFGLVTVVLALV